MSSWLSTLDSFGEVLLRWALWMNVWCAAMLAAAVIADQLLARRVAPTWRILLYLAVFVRIALPLSLETPIGLSAAPTPIVQISLSDPQTGAAAAESASVSASGQSRDDAASDVTIAPAQLAVPVYAAGVAVLCLAWYFGAQKLRKIVNESKPTGILAAAGQVPVLRHRAIGPVLIGAIRPRLVIPEDLEVRAGACGLGWVLRHEAAHVARRDPILAALLHASVIAAWPVVAVWVAAGRMRALMEEACDERALLGESGAARAEYGRTLVELATMRAGSRFAPVLPFGTGLRSRVRALAWTTRWPMALQGGLVAVVAAALVACAGSRGSEQQRLQATQLENAEFGPFKGSLPIRVTILKSWPKHPKLDFALGQVREGTPEPDWSIHRILSREEFAEVLNSAERADAGSVLSRPRLEVIPGGKATVSVGVDVRDGKPTEGFTLDSTVTLVEIPAGSTRRVYTMDLEFARYGDVKTASTATVHDVRVPQGETVAMLATGLIGGEMLLVCVSPGPDETVTAFGADAGAAKPAVADTRPLIEFTANIHRVDAPKDYGSPKGDGPRQKWSAYPGGQALFPKEFASYMTELRNRPGYSLLAAPRVWVYPDQDATIEIRPEAEDPTVVHRIKLRGTLEGEFVRFTGSYARSADGSVVEGSWNQSRPMAPLAGMVWSIHDSKHGAWYTVTIQAQTREQGSIKPQTATGISGFTPGTR